MLLDLLYSEDIDIKDLEKYFLASSQGQAPGFSPKNFITIVLVNTLLRKKCIALVAHFFYRNNLTFFVSCPTLNCLHKCKRRFQTKFAALLH